MALDLGPSFEKEIMDSVGEETLEIGWSFAPT